MLTSLEVPAEGAGVVVGGVVVHGWILAQPSYSGDGRDQPSIQNGAPVGPRWVSSLVPILKVRRHRIREMTGGSQLSQEGVELARRIGQQVGPFSLVATSVVPRAWETGIAMGFAVDHELITLSGDPGFWADVENSGW